MNEVIELPPGVYPANWPVTHGEMVWPSWGNIEFINPGLVGLCALMSVVIVLCPLPLRAGGNREEREIMEKAVADAAAADDLTVEDLGATADPPHTHSA